HPLLESGRARLGWWSLAAGRYPESVAAFRAYLTSPKGNGPERPWVEAGLALALFPSDPDAARGMLRGLEGRRSPLVVPLQIRLTRAMIDAKKPAEVPALTQDLLSAALLLRGDAAYYAGDHVTAAAAFRRVLTDVPGHAQAPAARLGLAWSLMRHDRLEDARKEFLEFAQAMPGDPRSPDALELASELALHRDADREEARQLLDRVI